MTTTTEKLAQVLREILGEPDRTLEQRRDRWARAIGTLAAYSAAQAQASEDERGAFEAWCCENGYDLSSVDGQYCIGYTRHFWMAWQARAGRASAQAVPAWIPVTERLPEKNTEVLVAFKDVETPATGQYTGHPRDVGGWCYPSENDGICDDGSDPVVTHWMPLPSAPSAQAEPTACPHTGQCHPGFCPCSDAKQAEQGGE